jgi:hypothetical protein
LHLFRSIEQVSSVSTDDSRVTIPSVTVGAGFPEKPRKP